MPDEIYERKARNTGTTIVLEDTEREGAEFSVPGFRFAAACREHATVVGLEADKWSVAYAKSTDPKQWCEQCAAMPDKPKTEPKARKTANDEELAEVRRRASEKGRKAAALAQEKAAEQARKDEVKAAKLELRELPAKIRKARREYDKAFAAANRAKGTKEEIGRAWNGADRAQVAIIRLRERQRTLEAVRDREVAHV
jgi:hypothetical protein